MSTHLLAGFAGVVVGMVLYWLFLRLIDRVAEDFTVTGHQPEITPPAAAQPASVVESFHRAPSPAVELSTRELAQRELGWDEPGDENIKI